MNNELTPYIKYWGNGNIWVKGKLNSVGQPEGIWEGFYPNGNIHMRIPFKEGKEDGIEEVFYESGNIIETHIWKDGKLIEITEH
jgi:antitoxin component YwqK of YwqJK toxin-antitoxin module